MHQRKTLFRLWSYLLPHRPRVFAAIAAMALVALTETAVPALIQHLIDHGVEHGFAQSLWLIPGSLVLLALIRGLAQFATNYLPSRVSNDVLLTLRSQMFARVLQAPVSFFANTPSASLINAVVFEVQQVLNLLSSVYVSLIRDSLTVIGLLAYLLWQNWMLTLIIAAIAPIIAWIMRKINLRLRHLNREQQNIFNQLSYVVEEVTGGHKVIKLHAGQTYEMQRFVSVAEQLRGLSMRISVASGVGQPVTQLLATIAIALVLVIAIQQTSAQHISIGDFTGFVTAMMLIISPLKHLTDLNQAIQRGLTAAELVFRLVDEPTEQTVLGNEQDAKSSSMQRARGDLQLQNVVFRYHDAASGVAHTTIDNLSLQVQAGEVIALVGPSGAGKSTLIQLLPRFLEPESGQILLDGQPLQHYALADLRRQFALVSQEVVLFNDSLAANVAYGETDTMDRARVQQALHAAQLDELVERLAQGIDTNIGDNGSKLSGGQRQRVAIARAIYKDAPILILDEATSALDSESERLVQAALDKLMQGRTTIIIAHRLSTIEHASRIAVLNQGVIQELGSHQQLLAQQGLYAHLHSLMSNSSKTGNAA